MSHGTLRFLTDFGDQAVILPVFAVVAVVLWAQRRRFLAGLWVLAVAGVLGTLLVMKLADQSCGWRVPVLVASDLHNPSGHAASATVLWGCGIGTLAAGRGWRTLAAVLASALAVAVLIGATRVLLGAHTMPETLVGAAVGVAGAAAFGMLARTVAATRRGMPQSLVPGWEALPVLAALLTAALVHGHRLQAEPNIHSFAVRTIRELVPACQPPPGSDADAWVNRGARGPP